jgi:hypothetical protein
VELKALAVPGDLFYAIQIGRETSMNLLNGRVVRKLVQYFSEG